MASVLLVLAAGLLAYVAVGVVKRLIDGER